MAACAAVLERPRACLVVKGGLEHGLVAAAYTQDAGITMSANAACVGKGKQGL